MAIPTNKLGILIAEIDSGGALRSAGDRVILGSRSNKSEQEWGIRQTIAECISRITQSVHEHHGIVVTKAAESVFGTFPNAENAFEAACRILERQTKAKPQRHGTNKRGTFRTAPGAILRQNVR